MGAEPERLRRKSQLRPSIQAPWENFVSGLLNSSQRDQRETCLIVADCQRGVGSGALQPRRPKELWALERKPRHPPLRWGFFFANRSVRGGDKLAASFAAKDSGTSPSSARWYACLLSALMRFTMRIGKTLRLAALAFALSMAVTPALVEYADAVAVAGEAVAGCVATAEAMVCAAAAVVTTAAAVVTTVEAVVTTVAAVVTTVEVIAAVAIMAAASTIAASTTAGSTTVRVTATTIIVAATVMVIGAAVFGSPPASLAMAPAAIARSSTITTTIVGCMNANKEIGVR